MPFELRPVDFDGRLATQFLQPFLVNRLAAQRPVIRWQP